MSITSTNNKVRQIHGLVDTSDVTDWENDFIESIWRATGRGMYVGDLTEKQLDVIERIWSKHFA